MKKVINGILLLCALALAWICVGSIVDDQEVEAQIDGRKKVVIARLLDIKKAQEAYKEQHDTTLFYFDEESEEEKKATFGCYAENFDDLIAFLKTARYPEQIRKEGVIQEASQRKVWTEKKVADFIYQHRQGGESDEAIREKLKAEELPGVWCDTIWAENPIKAIFGREDYPVDSLRYIPFSNEPNELYPDKAEGEFLEFDMQAMVHFKMKVPMNYVMQCEAHFNTFLTKEGLGNVGNNKRKNLVQQEEERGNYPGLRIGDIANWNNNAGNWE